jgi:hypothetical protein
MEVSVWRQHGTSETSVPYQNITRGHNPQDGGSMDLWNVGILPHHYTGSRPRRLKKEAAWTSETSISYITTGGHNPEDWRRRQHGPLKRRYPITSLHGAPTQKTKGGGSMDLWNVGILPHYYTGSRPRRLKEAAWTSETSISCHITTRGHNTDDWRRRQHGPLKRRYPIISLHAVTKQKTAWIFTAVKTSNVACMKMSIRYWILLLFKC